MDSTPKSSSLPIDWFDTTITPAGVVTDVSLRSPKLEETLPRDFRYLRKRDGTLVLQGAYFWTQGWRDHGHTWRDIPVVDEE